MPTDLFISDTWQVSMSLPMYMCAIFAPKARM